MANNNEEHVAQKIVTIGFDNEEFRENVEESIAYLEKFEDAVETFEKNINDKAKKISGSLNTLNNLNFSKDIESGLTNINNSIKEIFKNEAFQMLSDQLDEISYRFTILGKASLDTFSSMVQRAMEAGISISKSLSIDNVFAGLSQYNNKNNAMRTIVNSLQGADASIEKVNKQLEDLIIFTDETSYNFQDMITNMGRFTSAGVALEPAAKAMMGIANWSAFVGKNAYEASRAYDVMARSIGQGYMNWMQFQSLSTANFMDQNSRKAFIKAAVDAKKITKIGENSFSTKKGTKFTTENMETTLNEKWLTTDVMASALGSYSKYAEAVIGYSKETGKTVSQVLDIFEKEGVNKLFDEFSIKAFKSAQEAKTFSEALDSVRVAAGAKFSHTFEILFGTVDEAKTMWTELANTLWDVFIPPIEALNGYLEELQEWGVFNDIINSLKNVFGAFLIVVKQVGDAFKNVFPVKSAEDISDITFALREFTRQMLPSKEVLKKFKKIMETVFLFFKKIIDIAKQLAKIISPLVSTVLKKFFDLAYAISIVIYDILQKIDFDAILNRISFAIETITKVISNFVVPTPDTSAFDAFAKKVEVPFNIIKSIAIGLINVLTTVKNFIGGILKDIFNGNLFANLNELLKFIRDVFITKLVIDFTFFFNNLIKGTTQALIKLNTILSNFGKGVLKTMKEIDNGDMTDSLLKFSGAILMLAFAIRILSSDANTSTGKIVLITGTLLALLAAAVRWASFYTINGKDISDKGKKFSNSLGDFLDSLDSLKKGTKKVKDIFKNIGDMLTTGGMAVARGINDIIFNITNSIDQFLQKKALSNMVIAFSAAIIAIAYSIHKLTSIKTEDIWKIVPALAGLAGGIYAISKAVKFLSKIDNNRDKGFKGLLQSIGNSIELMSKSIAMIALSGAITLLTGSFIKLSQLKIEQIGKGFLGIAASAAVLAGAIKLLSTTSLSHNKERKGWGSFVEEWKKKSNLLSMSVTMLAISAAINNLATSLERLGKLDLPTLGKGIGAIALTMGILVGALKLLSTTTTSHEKENKGKGSFLETFIGKSNLLSMSVAVLSLAGAINILTNSIIRLGEQNIGTLAKGIASIAVILVILVKVLNNIEAIRKQQESGAFNMLSFLLGGLQAIQQLILPVTLIAIAGAIMILIQAIQQLMNMDAMELLFRIIALAGVAAILVKTFQSLNEVNSLNLLGISASLLGMAAAFLIFSGAILVLTPALKTLTEINIVALIAVMVALVLFTTFLVGIAEATGGAAVLVLLGIGAGLMLVGAGAILCAMAISILVDALIALLNCLADIIHGGFADILAIFGIELPKKMEKSGMDSLKGFEKGADKERKDLNNTMKDIANKDVADTFNKELKIESPSKLFEESGEFVLKGLNEGLEKKSLRKDIRDTVKDLANEDVSETFNDELGIHSNSDEFIDKGGFIDGGLAEGTTKNKGVVENAMETLSNTVINSFTNNSSVEAAKKSGQEIVSSLSTEIKDGVGGLAKETGIDKMVDEFGKEIKKEVPELETVSNVIGDAITKGADPKNTGKEIKDSVINEIKKNDSLSKEAFQLGKKIGQGMRIGLNSSNWMSVEDFKKYENKLKQLGIKYQFVKEYDPSTGETIREGYQLSNSFDSKKLYEENKKDIDKFTYAVSKLYNSGEGRSFHQGEKLSEEELNKYKDYIDLLDLKYREIENYNPINNTWTKDYEIQEDFGISEIVSLLNNIDTNTRDINYLKKLIAKGEGREFQEEEVITQDEYEKYGKFIKNSGVELEEITEKVQIGTRNLSETEKNINELNNILQPNRFINEKKPSFLNDTNKGKPVFVEIKKYKVKKGILFATKAEYDSYIDEYNRILESEEDAEEILNDYTSADDYARKMLAKDNKIFVNNASNTETDEEKNKKEQEKKQKEREAKINKDYQGKDINAEIWHELNNIASIYEASGLEKSKAMQKATKDTLGYYNALLKVSKEEDENYDKNLTQNAALAKVRAESLADYKNTLQQQYNNNKFGLNSVEATTANIDYSTAKNNIKMQKQKIENFMNGFKRLANAGLSAELANVIKNEGYWNSSTFAMLNNMSDKEIQRYQDAIKEFDEYFINAQSLISSTHLAIDVKQHYKNETDKKKKELDDQVDIDTNMLKASGWTSEDIKKHIEQKYKEAYKNLGIDKNFTVETPKPGTITIKSSNPDIKIDNKNKSAEEEIQNKLTTVSGHSGTDSSIQTASKDPNKDEKNRIENSSLYNTIEGWIDEYTNADIEEKDVQRLIRIAARKDYDKDKVRELFENEGYSWEEDEIPEDGEEEVYYSVASKNIGTGINGDDHPGVIWSNKQMHQGETKSESQGEQMATSFVEGLNNTLDEQGSTIIQNTADQAEPIIQDSFLNILDNLIQNPDFLEKCIQIGMMIAQGLSNGMNAGSGGAEDAGHDLGESAANAAADGAQVESPSKITTKVGRYIAEGLANGIRQNTFLGTDAAYTMAADTTDVFRNAFSNINNLVDDELNDDWSITPVVNLDNVEESVKDMHNIFANKDLEMIASAKELQNEGKNSGAQQQPQSNNITFTQNNYSPKSLSRLDIYRQTNNQFSKIKTLLENK